MGLHGIRGELIEATEGHLLCPSSLFYEIIEYNNLKCPKKYLKIIEQTHEILERLMFIVYNTKD